jgi:Uncharacterised nucleotidyltransferase
MTGGRSTSRDLATILRGSWRATPAPLGLSPERLVGIAPLLIGSGTAGLAWWRVRSTDLSSSRAAVELRQVYRMVALTNARQEEDIVSVFAALRAADLEPILIKGWAVARLYPTSAVRSLGDIDLLVPPTQEGEARKVLQRRGKAFFVDLEQPDLRLLSDRSWHDVFARSQLIPLEGAEIRVPCLEDHLALLCIHLLRHGGWRPLWLCDIAAAVESRAPDFDWNVCLGSDERVADWIACALGLASQVLGADLGSTPVASRAERLPSWLVPALLRQWETPTAADHPIQEESVLAVFHHPTHAAAILRKRWWNPIRVTVWANGRFDERSRLPLQLRNYGAQARTFASRLGRSRQEQP